MITYELSFVANCYCDKIKNKKYHDLGPIYEVICVDIQPYWGGGGVPKTRNLDTASRGRCPF